MGIGRPGYAYGGSSPGINWNFQKNSGDSNSFGFPGFDPRMAAASGGFSAMGTGLAQMFSPWDNPYEAGQSTINNIPNTIKPYYEPSINAGNRALPNLESNYGALTSHPGQKLNEIGGDFHASPGFQFALKQALMGAGNAEAARGMMYSPEHQQINEQTAVGLADQDYYNYLNHAMNLFGTGLQGEQGLYNTGVGSSRELGESLGNVDMSKAIQQILAAQAGNEHEQGGLGAFLGGVGSALPAFIPGF